MGTEPIAAFQYGIENSLTPALSLVTTPAASETCSLPQVVSLEIRKAIRIHRFRRGDALELARKSQRALVERGGILTEGVEFFDPQQALAAYVDRRRLKGRHRAEAGMECSLHSVASDGSAVFLVEAKADGDKGAFAVRVEAAEYRQARERLLAVIEAAGNWLDPCWFDRVIRKSSAIRAKTKRFSRSESKDRVPVRRKLTAEERLSTWAALRRTMRAMCHQLGNSDLSFDAGETEITIELPERAARMRLLFQKTGIVKITAEGRELICMVKTCRRGFAFESRGTLLSSTHLTIGLLHELRTLRPKRSRGG